MTQADFTCRWFVDTNVLIDATVTPEPEVVTFLSQAASHNLINLVTTDYVLWEKIDFVRMQNWIKSEIASGKSYKNALSHSATVTEELRSTIVADIEGYDEILESKFNIANFNIMDSASNKANFFEFLKKLMCSSTISKQDLLVLLSAHDLECDAILSKDKLFNKHLNQAKLFEEALQEALIPDSLKNITFIKDLKKTPNQYYKTWFETKIQPKAIFKITDKIFQDPNVVEMRLDDNQLIAIDDYLYFLKVKDEGPLMWHSKIEGGMMRDFTSKQEIQQGNHVTIKLPQTIPVGDLRNSFVFSVE